MGISLSNTSLNAHQNVNWATLLNTLFSELETYLDGIDVSADFAAPIELTRRRQHLDGGRNSIYNFKHWMGLTGNVSVRCVTGFGAAGDGSADDTAEIQAAFDDLPTTGGIVIFPPGNYKISSPIEIDSSSNNRDYVTVLGFGNASRIFADTGATVVFKSFGSEMDGAVIANLQVDGNSIAVKGIDIRDAVKSAIIGCWIHDTTDEGIALGYQDGTGKEILTIGNEVWNCGTHGIQIYQEDTSPTGVRGMMVNYNRCHDCDGDGIRVEPADEGTLILGNHCYDNSGNGISAWGSMQNVATTRVTISSNHCWGNAGHGIITGSNDADTTEVLITRNVLHDNTGDGIRTAGSSDTKGMTISNNLSYLNTGHGIRFEGYGEHSPALAEVWTGFEGGDNEFISGQIQQDGGTVATTNALAKKGARCLEVDSAASSADWLGLYPRDVDDGITTEAVDSTTCTGAFWIRIATAPAANDEIVAAIGVTGGTTYLELRLNSSRNLALYQPSTPTLLGTGSTTLALDTWYWIELVHTITDATNGSYILRIDGIVELSGTGAIGSSSNMGLLVLGKKQDRHGQAYHAYYDDASLWSGNFRGELATDYLVPNATDNADAPWVASGAATIHEATDDIPGTGADSANHPKTYSLAGVSYTVSLEDTTALSSNYQTIYGVSHIPRFKEARVNFSLLVNGTGHTPNMTVGTPSWLVRQYFYTNVPPELTERWTMDDVNAIQLETIKTETGEPNPAGGWDIDNHLVTVLFAEVQPSGDALAVAWKNNVCFDNGSDGISFESLGDTKQDSTIMGNVCFDDQGASATQDNGINLSNKTQSFAVVANVCDKNATAQIADSGTDHDISHNIEVS